MTEFLQQEMQAGFIDGVVRRQPKLYASKGFSWLLELVFSALLFKRMEKSIVCVLIEMPGQFYVSIDFLLPRSYTKIRSSQLFPLSRMIYYVLY